MEVGINILDTFPSFNKLSQKNNLLLEYNNKEYNLNSIINQQDIFSIKENASQISFKIYVLSNNNKVLIGTNQINIDSLNSDNKSSIIWLEFKKKIEENKKEINDLNLLFYDCIRLKIKVSKIKTITKTDKKLKTNKSKIKFGSPNEQMKKIKKKYNIKENNNLVNSCRIGNTNNYLLKSNSLKDNIRTIVDNNVKNEDNDKKDTSKDNDSKHIMEKYSGVKNHRRKMLNKIILNKEKCCILIDKIIVKIKQLLLEYKFIKKVLNSISENDSDIYKKLKEIAANTNNDQEKESYINNLKSKLQDELIKALILIK